MTYKIEFYKDEQTEIRWRVTHRNGNIIAVSSEGYKNLTDATTAFKNMLLCLVEGDYKLDICF